MTPIQSLTDAECQAEARVADFRGLLGFVLAVEGAFALWLLISAVWSIGFTEIEAAGISPGLTGAILLWAVLFQVPGFLDPDRNRLAVVIGVVGRYGLALVLGLLGLWLAALVTAGFALALNLVYHRTVRTILMSRP